MDFKVQTIYEAVDKAAGTERKVQERAGAIGAATEKAKGGLLRLVAAGAGFMGLGFGVSALARGLFGAVDAAQNLGDAVTQAWFMTDRLGSAAPHLRFQAATERSVEAVKGIHEMAAQGVASIQTYSDVFTTLALPALDKAGVSQQRLLDLTQNFTTAMGPRGAVGAANMLSMSLAGVARLPPREMMKMLGMTIQEWQRASKQGPEAMFRLVESKTAAVAPHLRKLYENLPDQLQRAKNQAQLLMVALGTPTVDLVIRKMQTLLAWVQGNRAEVQRIAEVWSKRVVEGIGLVFSGLRTLSQHWQLLATAFIAPKLIGGMASLAASMRNLTSFKAGVGSIGSFTSNLASAGGGLIAFTVAAQAAADMLVEWGINRKKDELQAQLAYGDRAQTIRLQAEGERKWISLYERMGGKAFAGGTVPEGIEKKLPPVLAEAIAYIRKEALVGTITPAVVGRLAYRIETGEIKGEALGKLDDKAPRSFDFRGSRIEVKQDFAPGFDPDRIAVAFAQDLARVGEFTVQSGFAPIFAVR